MKKIMMGCALSALVAAVCFGQGTNAPGRLRGNTPPARPGATATNDASFTRGGVTAGVWTQDFDAAKALAKEKNLPLFLNFTGSDWCGWCQLMDRQVFSTSEWKQYAKNKLVLVTVDFPKDKSLVPEKYVSRNQTLKKTYGVGGYPAYVMLSPDGEKTLGRFGASQDATPQKFIRGIRKETEWPALIAKLGEADRAMYNKLLDEKAKIEKEMNTWLDAKPANNPANTKKYDGFQKRIDTVEAKMDALLTRGGGGGQQRRPGGQR